MPNSSTGRNRTRKEDGRSSGDGPRSAGSNNGRGGHSANPRGKACIPPDKVAADSRRRRRPSDRRQSGQPPPPPPGDRDFANDEAWGWLDGVDTSDQLEGDTQMQINKHLRGAYAMALRLAWTAATDADAQVKRRGHTLRWLLPRICATVGKRRGGKGKGKAFVKRQNVCAVVGTESGDWIYPFPAVADRSLYPSSIISSRTRASFRSLSWSFLSLAAVAARAID